METKQTIQKRTKVKTKLETIHKNHIEHILQKDKIL